MLASDLAGIACIRLSWNSSAIVSEPGPREHANDATNITFCQEGLVAEDHVHDASTQAFSPVWLGHDLVT
jgi:hypothetical protein